MISIESRQDLLEIGGFPDAGLVPEEMALAYRRTADSLGTAVQGVRFDLNNVRAAHHGSLALLIAVSELCVHSGKNVAFLNPSDESLRSVLTGLGFDVEGNYRPKEFRTLKPDPIFVSAGNAVCKWRDDAKKLVEFIGDVLASIGTVVRNPRKLDVGEILYYVDKSGADAIPIVALICFLVGLILAFQGLAQMGRFGLEIYVADLVALALVRELGPLMVAMICIGRAGSAYAAELGTMKVAEEIDAMRTMGLKPARFLVLPKMIALVIAMPMLVIIGDVSGIAGGVVIGVGISGATLTEYLNRTIASLIPANVLESLVKGLIFAFIVAAVGCFRGFESENDAKGVGGATTSAVVTGIFLVVVADFLVTFLFPQLMHAFGIEY